MSPKKPTAPRHDSYDDPGLWVEGHTERGFQIVEFTDRNAQECSIQQSSAALCEPPGAGALWIGPGDSRMHINVGQARLIVAYLNRWIETCDLFRDDNTAAKHAAGADKRS